MTESLSCAVNDHVLLSDRGKDGQGLPLMMMCKIREGQPGMAAAPMQRKIVQVQSLSPGRALCSLPAPERSGSPQDVARARASWTALKLQTPCNGSPDWRCQACHDWWTDCLGIGRGTPSQTGPLHARQAMSLLSSFQVDSGVGKTNHCMG